MPVLSARQPVIILGMHRSGTSMVSQLLDQLGLFVGRELQDDHESTHFLSINETIFARVGASWDNPLPMRYFLASPDAVQMTAGAVAADLSSRRIGTFFSPRGIFSRQSLKNFDRPWGWKDPRTIFTLPVWLNLFPQARLISIVRNGVDVASSLMVREQRLLQRRKDRFESRLAAKLSHRSALERAGFKGSPRCFTLDGGFEMWREYVEEADRQLTGLTNPVLSVRYEDILDDPEKHLTAMARFSQLDGATASQIQSAAAKVNKTRARAFSADPALSAFYERIKTDPWMTRHGY
jgi:hypothetical protein